MKNFIFCAVCWRQAKSKIHLKLTKAAKVCKVYLSEKIQANQIKEISIWHTTFWKSFSPRASKQFSGITAETV